MQVHLELLGVVRCPLGGILSDAQTYFFSAWWIVVFPGIFLVAIVLCVNLIGDYLRDYLDPRMKL